MLLVSTATFPISSQMLFSFICGFKKLPIYKLRLLLSSTILLKHWEVFVWMCAPVAYRVLIFSDVHSWRSGSVFIRSLLFLVPTWFSIMITAENVPSNRMHSQRASSAAEPSPEGMAFCFAHVQNPCLSFHIIDKYN